MEPLLTLKPTQGRGGKGGKGEGEVGIVNHCNNDYLFAPLFSETAKGLHSRYKYIKPCRDCTNIIWKEVDSQSSERRELSSSF